MNRLARVTTLIVVLLLVSAIPATVAAQAAPQNVLLDQETTKMASMTIDGQTYDVYRIENVVWYASGIDIYADGERVRSESTARQVLTKLARRRAIEELGPDDLNALRLAKQNVSDAAPAVSTAARDIDEALTHLSDLKTRQIDDTTAYNRSVEAAPGIEEFNQSARDLLPELRSFNNDSTAFVENATTLIELIHQRQNGTSVDPQRLYETYIATLRANDAVDRHVGVGGGIEGLSDLATTSETIADNVTSVPQTGNRTAEHFEAVANSTGTAANRTQTIEPPGFEFEQVQDRAQSLESDWMDRWNSRQNAGKDVYNTIFALVIAVIVLVGYRRWKRR